MLQDIFVKNTQLLGCHDFTFDVCMDLHQRSQQQIKDLVAFAKLTRDKVSESEKVVLVIDHICKPDMSDSNSVSDAAFMTWRAAMHELGQDQHTFIKFSGGFSEMGDSVHDLSANASARRWRNGSECYSESFGPSRMMFGSDWSVFTINMLNVWSRWRGVTVQLCQESGLTPEEQSMIFPGTVRQAYNL